MLKKFYAHGKLLLTGEYLVLDDAEALAIPTRFGQRIEIDNLENSPYQIKWQSYNTANELWLNTYFPKEAKNELENRLDQILKAVEQLNPTIFYSHNFHFKTFLEFPNAWGLGSSSTLISLLAQWANVNPYTLLQKTFGGSGYDIACATASTPIIYTKNSPNKVQELKLSANWTSQAYFIYLNKKKNSRDAIAYYHSLNIGTDAVRIMDALTRNIAKATDIADIIQLIDEHERFLGDLLNIEPLKKQFFPDFIGTCKSLGAWGGDFIMAVSQEPKSYVKNYFKEKGLNTFFTFEDMIWKQ